MQRVIKNFLVTSARIYLRKIEVRGASKIPKLPAIYAGNHPSGLIDPLVVMAALPEKHFCSVAKSSLFDTPIVSYFIKTMEAIPVAKAGDGDMSPAARKAQNQLMFDTTKSRLLNGRNICIFPEGTCHSTPTIKALKIGTAKMAFEVALNNGPRIPIVPLGLSYSTPSGSEFRGAVLVDVGNPIHLTDELVQEYEEGDRSVRYKLCSALTDQIERRLRDCTIRVPSWDVQLESLCAEKDLPPPLLDRITDDTVTPHTYIMKCTVGTLSFTSSSVSVGQPNHEPQLSLEAAKHAFFSLSGSSSNLNSIVDRDFVEVLHLARRVYKPHNVSLNLAQYASLTRNFMRIALKNSNDPAFRAIWTSLSAYKDDLEQLGITDKYVSAHSKGSDPLNERLNKLRSGAKKDIAALAFFGPLSLFGTIVHAPIIAGAWQAGQTLGTEKGTGDISVVATMRLLTAFVGVCVCYPVAVAGAGYAYGATAALATVPVMSLSAYAAINYPVQTAAKHIRGSYTLLTQKDSVDRLRDTRAKLQTEIRKWADEHSPEPEMVGWWKDPMASVNEIKRKQKQFESHLLERDRYVKMSSMEQANMTSVTIELTDENKRQENERAVLTFKQDDENRKALVWLPGRNDSFFHVHVLQQFLDAGWDVFALDLRRCGRAKVGADGKPAIADELLAHDSYGFEEYDPEIDATMKFIKNPNERVEGEVLQGGCGKVYDNIVVYAHSTGALIAGQYGMEGGWRGAIDGYVFNSPFWSWNLGTVQKAAVENAYKAGLDNNVLIHKGGGVSDYSVGMKKHYHFSGTLKSDKVLAVSVGWCKAVTLAQERLKKGNMVLKKPVLVLSTTDDEILDSNKIDEWSDFLTKDKKDGKENTVDGEDLLVERVIDSSVAERSSHDVLAADSAVRVSEAMGHIESWLIGRYGFRPV